MARSALLNVMAQAAMKAGRSLARDFGEVQNLQVSIKGPGDYVSNADKTAEKIIRDQLLKARPDFGFLMEESGEIKGKDPQNRWIVDPLDGTINFLHGLPIFAVSIALEREGKIVAGVIYNPAMDELFAAEKGQGAYMNDHRLRVAQRKNLDEALIATGIPHLGRSGHGSQLVRLAHTMRSTSGVRSLGSAALDLAYVAAGRLDGFFYDGLDYWDVAAGDVLVREAGGYISDYKGGQNHLIGREIVCGNERLHKSMLEMINRPAPTRKS